MNAFESILHDRARVGLTPARALPLWRWRVSPTELDALRQYVRDGLSLRTPVTHTCAAFCLFASAHFCAAHDGGSWSWEDITAAVEWRLHYAQLYPVIQRGMDFWRRPILTPSRAREFLVTLACEGGLPLKLLARDDANGPIARYLRELLRLTETWKRPAEDFAETLAPMLPRSLQNDQVVALLALLVDAVVGVRVRAGDAVLGTLDDLERRAPGWLDEIPVRLDDATALSLVRGLLRAPAVADSQGDVLFGVTTRLVLGETATVERSVRSVRRVTEDKLSSALGVAPEALPDRMTVWKVFADGQRASSLTLSRVYGRREYLVEPAGTPTPLVESEVAAAAVGLCFTAGAVDLGWLHPDGGDALPADLPWVFDGTDATAHELLAVGSYRCAAPVFLVAPPPGTHLLPEGDSRIEALGRHILGRSVLRVEGAASWHGDGGVCSFRTRVSGGTPRYAISGRPRRAGAVGSLFFQGLPDVVSLDGTGLQRSVPSSKLAWRPCAGPRAWRPWSEGPIGDIELRVFDGAEPVFAARITVLPSDGELLLRALDEGTGVISIRGSGLTDVALDDGDERRLATRDPTTGVWELNVRVKPGASLEPVRLGLRFGASCEATLTVPAPVCAAFFADWDGSPIAPRTRVRFERIASLHARAITTLAAERFVLQGRMNAREGWRDVVILPDRGTFRDVSLGAVQEFLSALFAAQTLDDEVELRILRDGAAPTPRTPTLVVSRYDARFGREHPDRAATIVTLQESDGGFLTSRERAQLRVIARPIERPEFAPRELAREGEAARWVMPAGDFAPGPWLIHGLVGEHGRIRPTLVPVPGTLAPSDSALVNAMRQGSRGDRERELPAALSSLATRWDHPDWRVLVEFAGTLGTLPAATFDVTRWMCGAPDVAVMALLKSRSARIEPLWRGLEQLVWLWGAVPVASWLRAFARLKDWAFDPAQRAKWSALEWSPSEGAANTVGAAVSHAPRLGRFTSAIVQAADVRLGLGLWKGDPTLALARSTQGDALLAGALEEEKQSLWRRHEDDWWPSEADPREATRNDPEAARMTTVFRVDTPHPWQRPVLDAPVVCAALSVAGITPAHGHLATLRRLRAFDVAWFDAAHEITLTRLLASPRVLEEIEC